MPIRVYLSPRAPIDVASSTLRQGGAISVDGNAG